MPLTYLEMAYEAIGSVKGANFKGVSRASIANFIKANFNCKSLQSETTAHFNVCLRNALIKGIENDTLKYGETSQRYKLTQDGRDIRKKVHKKLVLVSVKITQK